MLKQISIFLENRSGRIYEAAKFLAVNKINIRALSLADTADFGVVRLIVNDPDETLKLLKDNNYTATLADVVAVEVEDRPGGLAEILGLFNSEGINLEYMYSALDKSKDRAIMIFRFDDNNKVLKKLAGSKIKIIDEKELG